MDHRPIPEYLCIPGPPYLGALLLLGPPESNPTFLCPSHRRPREHRNGPPLRRRGGGSRAHQPAHQRRRWAPSASWTVPTILSLTFRFLDERFISAFNRGFWGVFGFVRAGEASAAMRARERRRAMRTRRRGRRRPVRSGSPGGDSASSAR